MDTLLSKIPFQGTETSADVDKLIQGNLAQAKNAGNSAWNQFSRMVTADDRPKRSLFDGMMSTPGSQNNMSTIPGYGQAPQQNQSQGPLPSSGSVTYDANGTPTREAITGYIREAAAARGIDPDAAVRVAESEGLNADPREAWQSNYVKNGTRERSYGPYQLYIDGGLGNDFMNQTGLDPRDTSTVFKQIDFALDHAAKNGWGAWYGADRVGMDNWQGISGYGN